MFSGERPVVSSGVYSASSDQTTAQAAAKLSAAEQDALAKAILAEVAAESQWERRLRETSRELEGLADEALKEHHARHTRPLDPDAE